MSSRRLAGHLLKGAALLALALTAALAAFVADAASATQAALAQAHASTLARARETQTDMLLRAETTLTNAWSQPLRWHAGALEAMSWISAQRGALTSNTAPLSASADFAERAVRASPMQGAAWTRLGALSLRGLPVRACTARACLAESVHVMPMLAADEACSRLTLLRLSGEALAPEDPRVVAFLGARPAPEEIRSCLDFLSARELYQALLRSRT